MEQTDDRSRDGDVSYGSGADCCPFSCPWCQSEVTRTRGSIVCADCGYAASHGAD